jgi:hypothetical protein
LMFLLARHRTGVTANTSVLIDNKPVAHGERLSIVLESAVAKCRSGARHPYSNLAHKPIKECGRTPAFQAGEGQANPARCYQAASKRTNTSLR